MKKTVLCSIILLFSTLIFAQAADTGITEPQNSPENKEETGKTQSNTSVFFTMGPQIMYNSDDSSAPSPIYYTLGFGLNFLENKPFNFQTRMSFSTNYFLWNGEDAKPAEIENRTATVINAMIDMAGMYTWGKNYKAQIGGGLGIFARMGFLSDGVDSSESDDVSSINSWFWSDMHFLYPQLAASYTYEYAKWQIGGEIRFYFPLGSFITGDGMDGFMATASVKIILPK